MTTTTLYSDKKRFTSFFLGLIRRNSGYIIFLTFVEFIFFPVQTALYLFSNRFRADDYYTLIPSAPFHTITSVVMISMITIFAAIVIGISQMAFMNSKRSVDVFHALPVSRDSMFTANLLASFVTVMLPLAINQIIAVMLTGMKALSTPTFSFNPLTGLTDFVVWCIVVFAILACIAFAQVQVGRSFDGLIFSMEVLFAPIALAFMTLALFDTFLAGFSISRTFNTENFIYFTPVAAIIGRYVARRNPEGVFDQIMTKSDYTLAIWLVLGIILFCASIYLYRRRKSEIAESTVTNIPLVLLGKLAAIYMGGNIIGLMITSVFGSPISSRWSYVIWTVLGALVVFIFLEFILLRGYRGISKSLTVGIASVTLVGIFTSILVTGGLGYETRVPSPDKVNSVTISYRGRYSDIREYDASTISKRTSYNELGMEDIYYSYNNVDSVTLTSEEAIKIVTDWHNEVAQSLAGKKEDPYSLYLNTLIEYDLKGIDQKRYYGSIPREALTLIAKLEDTEEFKRKTHPIFILPDSEFTSFLLNIDREEDTGIRVTDKQDIDTLLAALKTDMLAEKPTENIGKKSNINLRIYLGLAVDPNKQPIKENYFSNVYADINDSFVNTIKVLKDLGFGQNIVQEHPEYTMAYVGESRYWGGRNTAIISILDYSEQDLPNMMQKFEPEWGEQLVTDKDTIQQLWYKGATQLYNNELVVSVFFISEDKEHFAVRLLEYKDLPDNVKVNVSYMEDRYAEQVTAIETR